MTFDFAGYFSTLTGSSPFPWQIALFERMLEGRIPTSCDLPTGLGKTSVMPIWLLARAAGASVPRRLVYVVDRRAVVDQATSVAERLREAVEASPALRDALRLQGPLPISTLRGKHLDNRAWLADPSAPAIVLGTVDMIGSRLLFGGYGVTRRMRPHHAGLLGVDSLLVLDEAHLVPPFERLIEAIASGRDGEGRTLSSELQVGFLPPLRQLSLSATGRRHEDALTLSDGDRQDPVVARRIGARKRGSIKPRIEPKQLPEALASAAWDLAASGTQPVRCVVFVNSRDDARKVQDALGALAKKGNVGSVDSALFVGGRRLYEREVAAQWLESRGFFAGKQARPERPTFVIATSAGEVGVDLDADHMVCDLVAWERMVQRLGRVNRRGDGDAQIVVIPVTSEDDDVRARHEAAQEVLEGLRRLPDGSIDASPAAITELKARAAADPELAVLLERASTPAVLHPPLQRATVEAWSMTSLDEHAGRPDVAPWIRGWVDVEEPQTTVVWRRHLPMREDGRLFDGRSLDAYRECAEPHLAERLDSETWRVVDWLLERVGQVAGPKGDDGRIVDGERVSDVVAVVLDGRSGRPQLLSAPLPKKDALVRDLAGALLIVDVRLGGLAHGLLDAESDLAIDVTEVDDERVVPFRFRVVRDAADASATTGFRTEARLAIASSEDEVEAWLAIESLATEGAESEEGRSVGATRPQSLSEHQAWTQETAAGIGSRLGLPGDYAAMLETAARLHDEGKRAERWQRAFRAPRDAVYAKTTARPDLTVLAGYRHELGSLPRAEKDPGVQALEPSLRELCLHLIAAHHGNARPCLSVEGAEEPPTRLAGRAREVALRFAALERRWGPWGLAWWEALLRAADQRASQRNDEVERG